MSLKKKQLNALTVTVLLGLTVISYFSLPTFTQEVNKAASILARADIQGMRIYLLDFGIWAPLISMALMVFQSIAAPLPAFVITFANAWIFGWVTGAVYSWTGAMIGAALCYWIAKAYGRPVVEKFIGKTSLATTDKFFAQYGRHSIMIARLLPIVPFDIISYAAGLTTMSFWGFFWATGIGQLPATLIYSWLGEKMSPTAKYAFGAISCFLVLLVASLAIKKKFDQKLAREINAK
ncbi:MAG: TVP38/TMEM64 family protein [Desulfitobacteriaceae bacterium]